MVPGGPPVIYNSFNGAGFTAWAKATNQEDEDSGMNNLEGSILQITSVRFDLT